MPKNKWKIARTALTKAPVKTSYNEYIDVETVLEDVLLCKGLDLCTYAETEAAETAAIEAAQADATAALDAIGGAWTTAVASGVVGDQVSSVLAARDPAHSMLYYRQAGPGGAVDLINLNVTLVGTTLTISDSLSLGYVGAPFTYVIFYKAL